MTYAEKCAEKDRRKASKYQLYCKLDHNLVTTTDPETGVNIITDPELEVEAMDLLDTEALETGLMKRYCTEDALYIGYCTYISYRHCGYTLFYWAPIEDEDNPIFEKYDREYRCDILMRM